jgi:hypothetical protein
MEAARWLFTTVIPPAASPAAEEPLMRDRHPEEVARRAVGCHCVGFVQAIPQISVKGQPALLAATGR